MKKFPINYLLLIIIVISCKAKTAEEPAAPKVAETTTPVTVTALSREPVAEYIELNATSTFMQRAVLKASASGYIHEVNAQIGKMVAAGQGLFTLKTKESQSIGNTINLLDSSFKFSGFVSVKAGTPGYVAEINHQVGDYVQEGEQLAVINDIRSFVFILNLPYELRPFVLGKKTVKLLLPDGKELSASVASVMPVVDSVAQTQNVVLTVAERNLPANLIAKVKVEKTLRSNTVSLPRQSVLSDETQTAFWVMKVLDSTTAVKVPVTRGIETADKVEILSPAFTDADRFLLTGNYGLADTAKINIIQP